MRKLMGGGGGGGGFRYMPPPEMFGILTFKSPLLVSESFRQDIVGKLQ